MKFSLPARGVLASPEGGGAAAGPVSSARGVPDESDRGVPGGFLLPSNTSAMPGSAPSGITIL
eukprot:3450136-Prymnesium_polylepis.1